MAKMNKLLERSVRHVLVYGPPKVGKTKLVGDLAEHGYELDFMDLESGSNTLFAWLSPEAQERVNLIRVPDTKKWPIAIETVMKVTKFGQVPYKICDTHGKIDCPSCKLTPDAIISEIDFKSYHAKKILVVDSSTQLSISSMNQIMKKMDDDAFPGWDEFRAQGLHLDMVFGAIQNCPYNVIVITHEIAHGTNELDKKERLFPLAGTRNYSRNFAKFFDDIVHMDIFNKAHRASSTSTTSTNVLTGSRSGIMLEKLEAGKASLLPIFTGQGPSQKDEAKKLLEGMLKK